MARPTYPTRPRQEVKNTPRASYFLIWEFGPPTAPAAFPMFSAHLGAAPSGPAEALTHEPPPRVSSPRGQLNGSAVLHQPPLPASRASGADAHRSSLQPLAWTAARWAARPMYSTAWPSSMAHTLIAPAPNSTGIGGLPRPSGFKFYGAIEGCINSGQDCGYVFAGSALALVWALFIAYVAYRHRQTMRNCVSAGCADLRQMITPPVSPRLGPSKA